MGGNSGLVRSLTLFDVTNLVVGSIIGADIYVAASFGSGLLGPASIIVWVIAGLMATLIALCFAECSAILPKVGGPYAYAREAWGGFVGFIIGWSLWLAEWTSLAVFPVAFTRYLLFFLPDLTWVEQTLFKLAFISFLTVTNLLGVKVAGRTNDVLTLAKLGPLLFFVAIGLLFVGANWAEAYSHFTPLTPLGLSGFGPALILIFWAYAGFELSTIPTDEVKEPQRTIPRAIVAGMTIVLLFYLTTNLIMLGIEPWQTLAHDNAPLATAGQLALSAFSNLGWAGGAVLGVGALISISGSDESGTLGTARVAYAMAGDGVFPRVFGRVHPKYKTPHLSLFIQGASAFVVSLLGSLDALISTSVFFMSLVYLATCTSLLTLRRRAKERAVKLRGGPLLPLAGIVSSLFLASQIAATNVLLGFVILLMGVPIYTKYTPKSEVEQIIKFVEDRQTIGKRIYVTEDVFLAHLLKHLRKVRRSTIAA